MFVFLKLLKSRTEGSRFNGCKVLFDCSKSDDNVYEEDWDDLICVVADNDDADVKVLFYKKIKFELLLATKLLACIFCQ